MPKLEEARSSTKLGDVKGSIGKYYACGKGEVLERSEIQGDGGKVIQK